MRASFRCIAISSVFLLSTTAFPAQIHADPLIASGTWEDDGETRAGTWVAKLYLAGNDVNGTFSITNFPGVSDGSLSGTLVGGQLHFGLLRRRRSPGNNPTVATFRGTVSGQTIEGDFTTLAGKGGVWAGGLETRE